MVTGHTLLSFKNNYKLEPNIHTYIALYNHEKLWQKSRSYFRVIFPLEFLTIILNIIFISYYL
jgi:hypothetical protein